MNGAAAHLIKKGDEIIVMGFELTDKPIQTKNGSQLLTGGTPLSVSFTVAEENIEILSAYVKAEANITETVTLTRTSVAGSTFIFILNSDSLSAAQTSSYEPGAQKVFAKRGDTITLACTAANVTSTVHGEILYREDI